MKKQFLAQIFGWITKCLVYVKALKVVHKVFCQHWQFFYNLKLSTNNLFD